MFPHHGQKWRRTPAQHHSNSGASSRSVLLPHNRLPTQLADEQGQIASARDRHLAMATPEQVVAAVHALYHGANLTQKAQANHWLTAFQQSTEAWQVPFALLVPEQPEEVQFFAATLLVRKVRTDWCKLDAGSRQGLSQAIR